MARNGEVTSLTELRAKLRAEGYGYEVNAITGKGLKMQLITMIADAKKLS